MGEMHWRALKYMTNFTRPDRYFSEAVQDCGEEGKTYKCTKQKNGNSSSQKRSWRGEVGSLPQVAKKQQQQRQQQRQ
jgi:hypothetical protein